MFTTCPNCKLNLAVTAVDLRIGQGYVRCGRCERVFNALLSLSQDIDSEQQSGIAATGTTTVPALTDTEEFTNITPIHPQVPDAVEVVESQATGTFETIVLEGDSFLQTEEQVEEAELDAQIQQIADRIEADELEYVRTELGVEEHGGLHEIIEYTDGDEAEQHTSAHAGEVAPTERDADTDGNIDFDLDAAALAVGNKPRSHWGWRLAASLLTVTLLGQMVHHSRQALVSQAWAQRPLQTLYGVFGVTLEPRWNLKAYDLRQLGGESPAAATDKIVLRASVHNRAANNQPAPMIRVTLQDRFGNALSTHAVAPQDYLQGAAPARMKPDQRIDAELTLDDPDKQAVGFELDACLPGADGHLPSSSDP